MGASRTVWPARIAMVVAIVASPGVASARAAGAATFTVVNTNASGPGSLNDAIAKATTHAGADTIMFAPATDHHALPSPDTIESDITVKGNGAGVTVVSGEFNVNSGGSEKVTAAFSDLSIGDFNINSGFGSTTNATVSNVDVTKDGLNINSGFNNSATTATLTNVNVSGGGGIDANAESSTTNVTITDSSVDGASAEPLDANNSGTTVTVFGSTFADGQGAVDAVDGAKVRMTNSTVTGSNEQGIRSTGAVALQNVTITRNTGGAVVASSGSMSIGDSILADNALGSGEDGSSTECTIEDAAFSSHGGNLADDSSCHPVAGDHANTAAKLGALAANGGPTETFLPLAGSAAIDGGVAAGCPSSDQRGVARPQDGNDDGSTACDVGAVEVAAAPRSTTTTSTTPVTAAATPTTVAGTTPPTTVTAAAQLPRTGTSSAPLALFGIASLAAGVAMSLARRKARVS